jgi:hypothetical protein
VGKIIVFPGVPSPESVEFHPLGDITAQLPEAITAQFRLEKSTKWAYCQVNQLTMMRIKLPRDARGYTAVSMTRNGARVLL